jgi:hypothetical protein
LGVMCNFQHLLLILILIGDKAFQTLETLETLEMEYSLFYILLHSDIAIMCIRVIVYTFRSECNGNTITSR